MNNIVFRTCLNKFGDTRFGIKFFVVFLVDILWLHSGPMFDHVIHCHWVFSTLFDCFVYIHRQPFLSTALCDFMRLLYMFAIIVVPQPIDTITSCFYVIIMIRIRIRK